MEFMKCNQKLVPFSWKVSLNIFRWNFQCCIFRNCVVNEPYTQIIIMAWSFDVKLLKLYSKCARSDYLFNRTKYYTIRRQNIVDRNHLTHIHDDNDDSTIRTWNNQFVCLAITTVVLDCCSQKPFQPIGFPIHHSCSSLSHTFHL